MSKWIVVARYAWENNLQAQVPDVVGDIMVRHKAHNVTEILVRRSRGKKTSVASSLALKCADINSPQDKA